jgi:hypothetical protein
VTDMRGHVTLATGEDVLSDPAGLEHLPFWKDPDIAPLMAKLRKQATRKSPGASRL